MNEIAEAIEAFKSHIERLAESLVEAIGAETSHLVSALRVAESALRHHPALSEDGGVYDPEIPVRLGLVLAALQRTSSIEDDWWWDFLYQSNTRKYTSDMPRKAWSMAGWLDLLQEVEAFGDDYSSHQEKVVRELMESQGFRFTTEEYEKLRRFMEPPAIVRWKDVDDVIVYVRSGGVLTAAVELAEVCERLGIDYEYKK